MPKISALTAAAALTDDDYLVVVDDPAGTPTTKRVAAADAATYFGSGTPQPLEYALSDEETALVAGTLLTVRAPYELTLTDVRASLTTASSSGAVSVDIEVDTVSALSTELTVDADEKTSETATPAVIGVDYVADDAEIAFVLTADGTGATGLKVKLYHTLGGTPPASDVMFVAASNTTYTTRTTTTVTKPTGTIDGDYILLGIITGAAAEAPDPTAPGGFTLLTGFPSDVSDVSSFNVEMRVYGRVASSEGASWDFTHTSCGSQGFAVAYRNVDTGTPLDTTPTVNNGTGTTSTATGLTTATNGAMVVFVGHDYGDTANDLTAPSGTTPTFTERIDVAPLVYVADGLLATAGATGDKTMTNNSGASPANPWVAALIALRPA